MKITISVDDLQKIVNNAKENKTYDSSLSDLIELKLVEKCPYYGADRIRVRQLSSYAECNPKTIWG